MKGDFSRLTHEPSKHYTGVLKQQGRVDLDADWNEYVEIQDHLRRAMETDLMGGTGVPDQAGGFHISWDTSKQELVVSADDSADPSRPSRIYVDSILCELEATQVPFEKTNDSVVRVQNLVVDSRRFEEGQWVELIAEGSTDAELVQIEDVNPATRELTLSSDVDDGFTHLRRITTYGSQPHYPEPDALSPASGRVDLVYLDVWQRHVTAIEDPDIREEALAGPDTTTRLQTVWQVKVRQGLLSSLPATCSPDALPDNWASADLGGGQLSTGGSYRGSENRLYRVEIHDGGEAADGGATFKWSRDNGTVVFPIIPIDQATSTQQKNKVRVSRLGRDQTLTLREGDWVEVGGDESELNGEPALITEIQKDGIDRTRLELTLKSEDVTPFAGQRHPKVRRWDQTEAGNGSFDPEEGACKVEEGKWIELEDGVQIRFEPGDPDHVYRRGDYWIFAVRAATSRVEELTMAPPRGVRHHYCPLALVGWSVSAGSTTAEIRDCRTRFGSLSGQLATVESFFYLGGGGQEAFPGREVLQPLRVGLSKGGQPLDNRQIRFTIEEGAGKLKRVGSSPVPPYNSLTVTTQGGVAECAWELGTATQTQKVRATVVGGSQASVIFTANLSGWSVAGNPGTNPASNFLGTVDNQPLVIRTNGAERVRFDTNGNVGIGTAPTTDTTPAYGTTPATQNKLDVAGSVRMLTGSNPIWFTPIHTGFSNTATDQAEISNDTETFKTLMIVGNRAAALTSPGLGRRVSVWDTLEVNGTLRMNIEGDLLLRGGTDPNHGIGWYGGIKGTGDYYNRGFAGSFIDGPVVYGWSGGALGTTQGGQRIALSWNNSGTVRVDGPSSAGGTAVSLGGRGDFRIDAPGVVSGRFVVKDNGPVGIGVPNPQAKLHISSGEPQLRLDSTGSRAVVQFVKDGAFQWDFGVGTGEAGNRNFWFGDFSAYRLVLEKGTGHIGIGTTDPEAPLHVSGRAVKTTGLFWEGVSSDKRLKKRIKPVKDALDRLSQLRGVSFEWRKPEERGFPTGTQMGLVAQEVEEVLPDWVGTDRKGYKTLTINGLEALVIEAFKELKAQNEALKMKNEELEKRIEVLEANVPASVEDQKSTNIGKVDATEAAQRRARELGVRLSGVKGTGSGGRVLVKDVEEATK